MYNRIRTKPVFRLNTYLKNDRVSLNLPLFWPQLLQYGTGWFGCTSHLFGINNKFWSRIRFRTCHSNTIGHSWIQISSFHLELLFTLVYLYFFATSWCVAPLLWILFPLQLIIRYGWKRFEFNCNCSLVRKKIVRESEKNIYTVYIRYNQQHAVFLLPQILSSV